MTALFRTALGTATHAGRVRTLNEDALLAAYPVFVAADGMGGHDAGELASAAVVQALQPLVGHDGAGPREVQGCLLGAQEAVRAIATRPGRGAGTTVSGVVVVEQGGVPYWLVVNVGDSRTYRLAGGELAQVSVDHSEVQELIEAGSLDPADAGEHPLRNVVTRAIGAGVELEPDFWLLPVEENDRMLVCTDGLTGEVPPAEIAAILLAEPDPGAAADRLVRAALEAGGRDNVTVLVVDAHDVAATDGDQTTPRVAAEEDEDTVPRGRAADMGVS